MKLEDFLSKIERDTTDQKEIEKRQRAERLAIESGFAVFGKIDGKILKAKMISGRLVIEEQ